ncbi:peptide chain release factor N(5)-glutamine methyltransferase [Algoriphagus namhaensis]
MPSFLEKSQELAQQLSLYESSEAQILVQWLFEKHFEIKRADLLNELPDRGVSEAFQTDFARLKNGEPIQYILGSAPFYGREFLVTKATLIPRNETEELVHWIAKENPSGGLRILDIGTGTGCIPISLFLEMSRPKVYGMDIAGEALEVARMNAQKLEATVEFMQRDILNELPEVEAVDILVSNPPYIPESGKLEMHRNVLDHEPEIALFVPDEDPLLFYFAIADKGRKLLKPGGKLYFEIHEAFGLEVKSILAEMGYTDIQLRQDLNGKDRMVRAFFEEE